MMKITNQNYAQFTTLPNSTRAANINNKQQQHRHSLQTNKQTKSEKKNMNKKNYRKSVGKNQQWTPRIHSIISLFCFVLFSRFDETKTNVNWTVGSQFIGEFSEYIYKYVHMTHAQKWQDDSWGEFCSSFFFFLFLFVLLLLSLLSPPVPFRSIRFYSILFCLSIRWFVHCWFVLVCCFDDDDAATPLSPSQFPLPPFQN